VMNLMYNFQCRVTYWASKCHVTDVFTVVNMIWLLFPVSDWPTIMIWPMWSSAVSNSHLLVVSTFPSICNPNFSFIGGVEN
jgi:hypothetical protein